MFTQKKWSLYPIKRVWEISCLCVDLSLKCKTETWLAFKKNCKVILVCQRLFASHFFVAFFIIIYELTIQCLLCWKLSETIFNLICVNCLSIKICLFCWLSLVHFLHPFCNIQRYKLGQKINKTSFVFKQPSLNQLLA